MNRKQRRGSGMNVAYHADCVDALRELPDNSFDLIIADPPYFSGPEKRGYYGSRKSKIGVHRDYPVSPAWKVPTNEDFEVIFQKARYYIVFGCNYFCDTIFAPGRILWDKVNGSSSFSDAEIAATNLFDSVRLFRYMWNGMLQGKSIEDGYIQQGNKRLNEKRIHPTQKPIALYEWIISTYAKQGWTICDPYLGSGSSRIAAARLGFDFIGYEKNEYYFEQQEKRYKIEKSQTSLFDVGANV